MLRKGYENPGESDAPSKLTTSVWPNKASLRYHNYH